jgi:hypothetical protein
VAAIVKAEMARRNITYRALQMRLQSMGIQDNEKNLSTKISRGKFSASFFFQCMTALDTRVIRLDEE